MSRFEEIFKKTQPFIAYITIGYGGLEHSFEMACALIDAGAEILELGVPFSDPIADGPVIQQAMQNALTNSVNLDDVLMIGKRLRDKYPDVPLVLFGYYNVFLQALPKGFFQKIKDSGIDGILIVDLPMEEGESFFELCKENNIAQIFLVTPATNETRLKKIINKASGFVYYVCHKGTTGARSQLPHDFKSNMQRIKAMTDVPVVAGFGISSKEMAKEVLQDADGFVVGSKLVSAIESGVNPSELKQLMKTLKP